MNKINMIRRFKRMRMLFLYSVLSEIAIIPLIAQNNNIETSKIYLVDKNSNTITKVLPIAKYERTSYPIIVYDATMENEIIYFLQQLIDPPTIILPFESVTGNISENFIIRLNNQFSLNVQRMDLNQYSRDFWINKSSRNLVITENQTNLTPYGLMFSALKHLPIGNSIADINWYVSNLPNIDTITYFGNDLNMLNHLMTINKQIKKIQTIDDAERHIARIGPMKKVVTIIPSQNKNSSGYYIDGYGYWIPGIIYACQRETMLITPDDSTYTNYKTMDKEIEFDLKNNLLPYNENMYPSFMTIFSWNSITHNGSKYYSGPFLDQASADSRHYGDIDGDTIPDISVGRIGHLMNNITITNLWATRGVFFEKLKRSKKALFHEGSSWLYVDYYGYFARPELYKLNYDVSEYYGPHKLETKAFLNDMAKSEIIVFSGHGNDKFFKSSFEVRPYPVAGNNYLSFNDAIRAVDFLGVNLAPSLWMNGACDNSLGNEDTSYEHWLSVLPRSGIVNYWGALGGRGSFGEPQFRYFKLENSIGEAFKSYLNIDIHPYFIGRDEILFGDPLVHYGGIYLNPEDNIPPEIEHHQSTFQSNLTDSFNIKVKVTDNYNVKHVEVWWRQVGTQVPYPYSIAATQRAISDYFAMPLVKVSNDQYEAYVPPPSKMGYITGSMEYLIKAHDINNTTATQSYFINLSEPTTGMDNNILDTEIYLYPNPTYSDLTIEYYLLKPSKINICISNLLGQELTCLKLNEMIGKQVHAINLAFLPTGTYILNIKSISLGLFKQSKSIKFIKK